jgi:hypothetical protein
MGPLASLIGARVERLAMIGIAVSAVVFEQAASPVGQRHGTIPARLAIPAE